MSHARGVNGWWPSGVAVPTYELLSAPNGIDLGRISRHARSKARTRIGLRLRRDEEPGGNKVQDEGESHGQVNVTGLPNAPRLSCAAPAAGPTYPPLWAPLFLCAPI